MLAGRWTHRVATPDGRHLYASNSSGDEVLILTVDGNDGSLTLIGQAPAGVAPGDLALRTIHQ